MPGRPRLPGTDAQRAAARRQQVRDNVRAFRQRNKDRARSSQGESSEGVRDRSRQSSLHSLEPSPSSSLEAMSLRTEESNQQAEQQPRISSVQNGDKIEWSLGLPLRMDLGAAYANSYIAAYNQPKALAPPNTDLQALVLTLPTSIAAGQDSTDKSSPSVPVQGEASTAPLPSPSYIRVEICCWGWTTIAVFDSSSEDCCMLKEALLASSLSLLSLQSNEPNMGVQAMHIQTLALQKLRKAFDGYLATIDQEQTAILSATAMAISMSELLLNKSWGGFSIHLSGIGALIEQAAPVSLESEVARVYLHGYRLVQLPFSIMNRKSTFLARSEWTNHLWRDEKVEAEADPALQTLVDIAYRLPTLMETYDTCDDATPGVLRRQLKKLDKIASALNDWHNDLMEKNSGTLYDYWPASWTGLHTDVLNFNNDSLAHSFTLYTAVRITLFSLVCQIADDLQDVDETSRPILAGAMGECVNWSRTACKCVENFFVAHQTAKGKLSCLLAFDRAWTVFATFRDRYGMDLERELAWCREAKEKIAGTGLPVFRDREEERRGSVATLEEMMEMERLE